MYRLQQFKQAWLDSDLFAVILDYNTKRIGLILNWSDTKPIYLQVRDKLVASILNGSFAEGMPIPSIRQIAEAYQINHLTVAKALQLLVEEGILEKRRGIGMFVKNQGQSLLLRLEQKHFLTEEWPLVLAKIQQLQLKKEDLFS